MEHLRYIQTPHRTVLWVLGWPDWRPQFQHLSHKDLEAVGDIPRAMATAGRCWRFWTIGLWKIWDNWMETHGHLFLLVFFNEMLPKFYPDWISNWGYTKWRQPNNINYQMWYEPYEPTEREIWSFEACYSRPKNGVPEMKELVGMGLWTS